MIQFKKNSNIYKHKNISKFCNDVTVNDAEQIKSYITLKFDKIGNVVVNDISEAINDIDLHKSNKIKLYDGFSFLLRVKDEEFTIRKCIEDIVEIANEIIVVSNNSTDDTINILKELENKYKNIYVYEYNIDIPRFGSEHIENFKKDTIDKFNTLTTYYNWTLSKAHYKKVIKWDGDFYCIKENLKELLQFVKMDEHNCYWFSGITLFEHKNEYFLKKENLYNEYRIFSKNYGFEWTDNIINGNNYCETSSTEQLNLITSGNIDKCILYTKPVFFEIKSTIKNEFSSRSSEINDGRDNIDKTILNKLYNNQNCDDYVCKYCDYNMHNNFISCYPLNSKMKIGTCVTEFRKYYGNNSSIWFDQLKINMAKVICLVIDTRNWAFSNIVNNILKYNSNKYIFKVLYLDDDYSNINLEHYDFNDEFKNTDHVMFFWYGYHNKLTLNKALKKNILCSLCVYDYSCWINNKNKKDELIYKSNLDYFMKNCKYYLYGSSNTYDHLKLYYQPSNYKCYDGVDSNKFYYFGYNDDLLTKEKLVVGWIGNSNPNCHGINKGYKLIEECIENIKDKFIFKPQDKFVKYIEHNMIPKYIEDIDIIVCFSIAEGTPNQILEASSMGKCWISTNVGIVNDLNTTLPDNTCGFVINRDKKELENILLYLYENRQILINHGKNGRKAITHSWDWKEKSQQFYNFFESVL